jgi:hypothetical protein
LGQILVDLSRSHCVSNNKGVIQWIEEANLNLLSVLGNGDSSIRVGDGLWNIRGDTGCLRCCS